MSDWTVLASQGSGQRGCLGWRTSRYTRVTGEMEADDGENGDEGDDGRSVSVNLMFTFRDNLSNEINTNQIEFVYIYLIIFRT